MNTAQSSAKTTVGFNHASTSATTSLDTAGKPLNTGIVDASIPAKKVMASSTAVENLLRPDPVSSHLYLLRGILHGSSKLARTAASEAYSKTFGLRIEKRRGEGEMIEDANTSIGGSSQRDTLEPPPKRPGRSMSPSAGSLLNSANGSSSSISPSPARNNRSRALAYRTEEEDGDDLDTLHLLENLLPPLPSSIVQEGPLRATYQQQGSSVTNRALSPRRTAPTSYFPTQSRSPSQKRLEEQLDSIAVAELRTHRETAQREVYELLKVKRKTLAQIENRIRDDAKRLLVRRSRSSSTEALPLAGLNANADDIKNANTPAEVEKTRDNESPFFERRRPLFPTSGDMMRSSSSQSAHGEGTSSTVGAINTTGGAARAGGAPSTSSTGAKTGGHLSASFAMRGRDLPQDLPSSSVDKKSSVESKEDEEEWYAQKRRLRERYPHGDHSALPSAVNSDDEGNVGVKKDVLSEEEAEQEQRGRGRGRGSGGRVSNESVKETNKQDATRKVSNGEVTSQPKAPQVGTTSRPAKLEPRYSSSSDESNKSSNTAKKGALKASTPVKLDRKTEGKTTASNEKRVAFAEGPSQVTAVPRNIEVQTSPKENIDEGADAVFEIDEDIDGDGTAGSSDVSVDPRAIAMQQEREAIQSAKTEDESSPEDVETIDEQELSRGSVAQSLPSVGSFSALAQSELFGREEGSRGDYEMAENFDPASLRFDGASVYTTQSAISTTKAVAAKEVAASKSRENPFIKANTDDTSIYGSRPLPTRKPSFDLDTIAQAGFPTIRGEGYSTIGFRVALGEAEARLNGLLAPYAPSHRNLWSSSNKDKLKLGKKDTQKYKLKGDVGDKIIEADEEDIEPGQEAWRKRLQRQGDATDSEGTTSGSGADTFARSVPIGMARSSLGDARRRSMAATGSSTIFYDSNSGFDLEPKTSLPYQEKKLTPSLRKATRHLTSSLLNRSGPQSSLATISDASEVGSATNQASNESRRKDDTLVLKKEVNDTNSKQEDFTTVDSSIPATITKGFQNLTIPMETTSMPTSTQSTPLLGSKGSEFGDVRASRKLMARGIYVQPPPPITTELRLTPNDENRPRGIKLQEASIDNAFAAREENEDGEEDYERDLKFMHILEQLKLNKRTGWFHHRIAHPESIADHMYRMAVLSMLLPNVDLDIGKCVQLCLVHDIAEALVGDLTPLDGVSRDEKLQREKEALLYLVHDLLGGSPAALRLEALWMEYEDRNTLESKVVKDLDRFELCLQAVEYEKRFVVTDLQPFFEGSLGFIRHVSNLSSVRVERD